jgi:hypothetical protein
MRPTRFPRPQPLPHALSDDRLIAHTQQIWKILREDPEGRKAAHRRQHTDVVSSVSVPHVRPAAGRLRTGSEHLPRLGGVSEREENETTETTSCAPPATPQQLSSVETWRDAVEQMIAKAQPRRRSTTACVSNTGSSAGLCRHGFYAVRRVRKSCWRMPSTFAPSLRKTVII